MYLIENRAQERAFFENIVFVVDDSTPMMTVSEIKELTNSFIQVTIPIVMIINIKIILIYKIICFNRKK